jgi:hypothetical protein
MGGGGKGSSTRTLTMPMPVAIMPPSAAGGPGATHHPHRLLTPIASSPAYPAYSHMHIVIEVEEKAEQHAETTRRFACPSFPCASCLRAACVSCARGIAGAMWAVVRWVLALTANTAVKIAFVLALVGACYYEYLLNTGKVSGLHDPRLKQYLYGALFDLFQTAKGEAGEVAGAAAGAAGAGGAGGGG